MQTCPHRAKEEADVRSGSGTDMCVRVTTEVTPSHGRLGDGGAVPETEWCVGLLLRGNGASAEG